jgi:hypothetical protein
MWPGTISVKLLTTPDKGLAGVFAADTQGAQQGAVGRSHQCPFY